MADSSNLVSVGGPLTNTIKADSQAQLKDVAINSGIQTGPVNNTNTWNVKPDNDYGVNIDSNQRIQKYPVNDTYTNK